MTQSARCVTAKVTETETKRTVKVGGLGNYDDKQYVIRFVHVSGNKRVTIVGQNQSGFTLTFAKDKETIVDAEFKALPNDATGTLIIYEGNNSRGIILRGRNSPFYF